MATPKGMPEYAKGTASAIAASKKEAELTKKVQATPLAKAPAPAISNAMATANSNINKYDVTKANQNASNAAQKATIAKQVEKQAPTPSVETFKKAVQPPSGVTGVAVDTLRSVFGLPPVSVEATTKPVPPTTTPTMPVYATGDVAKIQDYTASNVAPMTEQEKKDAFIQAVQKRMEVEKDLMGERVTPPSTTALQNRAIESVNQNLQTAQERITGSTPLPQTFPVVPPMPLTAQTDLGTTATKEVTSTTPPAEKAPYVALGEETKTATTTTPTPTTKEKIITGTAQDKAQNYADGFAREDGYVWNATVGQWESPDIWQNTLKNREAFKAVVAPTTEAVTPTPTPQVEKGTPTEQGKIPDGFKDERGYTWNANAGQWESADVWANTLANRNRMAGQEATFAGLIQDAITAATGQAPKTDVTPTVPFTPSQPEQRVSFMPFGKPTIEPPATGEPDYQKLAEESAFARATQQVDAQIASKNAELDKQIAQAQNNRDYQTAQNLQAFKSAVNQMRDTGFLQSQQAQQQMANRGLLGSGMATDAQVRLQMSMNQNMRDLAQKQQIASDKLAKDFQTRLDAINEKKTKLQQGRTADIEKAGNAILKEIDAMDKIGLDLRKLQVEENKNLMNNARTVLDRLAKQGYNTAPLEAVALTGNVNALAQAMENSGEPQLSLLGKDMKATIEATNAKTISYKRDAERVAMQTKGELSDIDKQRSETMGYVFVNGKMLKDSKGNPIPTAETIQNNAKLSLDQKKVAIDKQRADTARAKANSKTSSEVKAMTQPQQLNFLQDAISTLVIPKFEDSFDKYGDPIRVKVGEELNPANIGDFNEIMADLWASGKVSPDIIQNQYRAFGLKAPTLSDMLDMKANPDR